jgi:hypothetical protein
MMSLYRPNHSGVAVGEVSAIRNGEVTIALKEDLNAQDILEIRYREEEGYEFTVKDNHIAGDTLTTYIGRRQQDKRDKRETGNQRSDRIRSVLAMRCSVRRTIVFWSNWQRIIWSGTKSLG